MKINIAYAFSIVYSLENHVIMVKYNYLMEKTKVNGTLIFIMPTNIRTLMSPASLELFRIQQT